MTTRNLTAGERSLLRATQLIYAASRHARAASSRVAYLPGLLLEEAVRHLLWQAMTLLPEGLPLEGTQPRLSGCLQALEEAEAELRRRPVGEYPDGVSLLVVDLCDVIARTRAGAWL